MNFHERQLRARRNTGRLLVLYAFGVTGIVLAVQALASGILNRGQHLWDERLLPFSAAGTLAIIGIGIVVGRLQLTGGGRAVAEACGGRRVSQGTQDPAERRFLNVVEEMSIASGVPMPEVFVLEGEAGLNAFAAGHTTDDYAVAVSRGGLERWTRDELQGVVAHEFSHILNGDMLRNIRLTGWLYGILGIAVAGRILFEAAARSDDRPRRRDGNSNGTIAFLALGLGLMAIGWIGQIFARAVQAAISRQREHLADASAVQFTRNPAGIAGALKKIAGHSGRSVVKNSRAAAFSHMFFASAVDSLFATHPPIEERIRLLDPQFNPEIAALVGSHRAGDVVGSAGRAGVTGTAGMVGFARVGAIPQGQVGRMPLGPTASGLRATRGLLEALPEEVTRAVQDPFGASAVIHGLLLGRDEHARDAQLRDLEEGGAPGLCLEVRRLLPALDGLPTMARLPVAALATGSLHHLSASQYAEFCRTTEALVAADRQVDLFEFALQRNLRRHLAPHFGAVSPRPVRYHHLAEVAADAGLLLSCLARLGTSSTSDPEAAFACGVDHLGLDGSEVGLRMLPWKRAASSRWRWPWTGWRRRPWTSGAGWSMRPPKPSPRTGCSTTPRRNSCVPSPTPSIARCPPGWRGKQGRRDAATRRLPVSYCRGRWDGRGWDIPATFQRRTSSPAARASRL